MERIIYYELGGGMVNKFVFRTRKEVAGARLVGEGVVSRIWGWGFRRKIDMSRYGG